MKNAFNRRSFLSPLASSFVSVALALYPISGAWGNVMNLSPKTAFSKQGRISLTQGDREALSRLMFPVAYVAILFVAACGDPDGSRLPTTGPDAGTRPSGGSAGRGVGDAGMGGEGGAQDMEPPDSEGGAGGADGGADAGASSGGRNAAGNGGTAGTFGGNASNPEGGAAGGSNVAGRGGNNESGSAGMGGQGGSSDAGAGGGTSLDAETEAARELLFTNSWDALWNHLMTRQNAEGWPLSYAVPTEFTQTLQEEFHLDWFFTYEGGVLFGMAAQFYAELDTEQIAFMNALAEKFLSSQDSNGFWPNAYGDDGVADAPVHLGPNVVLARGLLQYSQKVQSSSPDLAARLVAAAQKVADRLLSTEAWKMSFTVETADPLNGQNVYAFRQSAKVGDRANPEENGRTVLLLIDLHAVTGNTQYLLAAEAVVSAYLAFKQPGGDAFPFALVETDGVAGPFWELANREGSEGQIVFLQALWSLSRISSDVFDAHFSTAFKTAFNEEWGVSSVAAVVSWVGRNYGIQNVSYALGGNTVTLEYGLGKQLPDSGDSAGDVPIWPEFTANTGAFLILIDDWARDNGQTSVANSWESDGWKMLRTSSVIGPGMGGLTGVLGPEGYGATPIWPTNGAGYIQWPLWNLAATVYGIDFADVGNFSVAPALKSLYFAPKPVASPALTRSSA